MHHHTQEGVQDPVCRMNVTVSETTPRSTYHGKDYYFCCPACKEAFDKDPAKYVQ
ncbi:MAG: YHS domain-containing protein [Actinomycetia bacterium]|nr:YHS domain-containing protein [Actinomycetes bacterium]